MISLQLLISTIDSGIHEVSQVMLPEPMAGVSYLVTWQHSSADADRSLPASLCRADIQVLHQEGGGLSRSRNYCLQHATADICMIADDDCRYTADGLRAVVNVFENDPTLDIATFMMHNPSAPKRYPPSGFDLRHMPRFYSLSSVEIALRRNRVVGRVRFNEAFGLGAERLLCAEESVFVADALAVGLRGRFVPVVAVTHDHPTTAHARAAQAGVLRGMGANLWVNYHSKMWFYPLPMAWRLHRHHGVGLLHALRHLYGGLLYAICHPRLMRQGRLPKQ